jgi:uncharacterized Tic20 family protein
VSNLVEVIVHLDATSAGIVSLVVPVVIVVLVVAVIIDATAALVTKVLAKAKWKRGRQWRPCFWSRCCKSHAFEVVKN